MKYDFSAVEQKWQKKWEEVGVFHAEDGSEKPKFYALVEFPYPSGAGMHVGHIKAYSGLEVVSRKRRMQVHSSELPKYPVDRVLPNPVVGKSVRTPVVLH